MFFFDNSLKKYISIFLAIIISLFYFFIPDRITLAPYTTRDSYSLTRDSLKWNNNSVFLSFIQKNKNTNYYTIDFGEEIKIDKLSYRIKYFKNLITEIETDVSLINNQKNKISASIWFRLLNNNDLMMFLRFNNKNKNQINLNYSVSAFNASINSNDLINIYQFKYKNIKYKLDESKINITRVTSKKIEGDSVYLRVNELNKTKMTIFKGALFQYLDKENGLIERYDTNSQLEIANTNNEIKVTNTTTIHENCKLDDWYLISEKSLLNIDSQITRKYLENTDFSMKKRYFENGFYYLTSNNSGLENEGEKTYYWDYSMYSGRSLLEFYFTGYESFIYDIAINSFYSLYNKRNEYGYWTSNTVSIWLKDEYGINGKYFDTRFSTDAGLFLAQLYLKFNIKEALSMSCNIGDILVKYIKDGYGQNTSNYGFLIYDYILSNDKKVKTHSSLNHLLNESYFLLQLYETTGDNTYKNACFRIIKGIKYYGNKWIDKSSGDLWYCILPNGSFGIKDYVTLTYNDLLRFKTLAKKVLNLEFPIIEQLGESKENFLYKKGIVFVKKFSKENDKIYAKREIAK
jgi:hypothetical protein